jgi:pilus biogenesis lipoprotein CpaD
LHAAHLFDAFGYRLTLKDRVINMIRIFSIAALLLLVGCQQIEQLPYVKANSATPSHNLKVLPVSYQFVIDLGKGGLVSEDRSAIERFISSHGHVDNQRLVIASDSRQQRKLAKWLKSVGFKDDQLRWDAQNSAPDSVMLITEYFKVQAPDCPNWQGNNSGLNHSQQRSSNFGCATATNLAAMVRSPRELVKGRSLGAANSDKMLSAMGSYLTPAADASTAGDTGNQTITEILGGQ